MFSGRSSNCFCTLEFTELLLDLLFEFFTRTLTLT
ncbi:hypothetical protein Halxa_0059 (plasmid) [Halopiger xanaduensis SH-6]|uniref:Uncharacterized protein n=2 Tax=Halopiger TaxID=387342 RepID=F8DE34_HALXS|nr:hypothetical protein Halxa_0059 [Halopiger xanaduensis SH-6]